LTRDDYDNIDYSDPQTLNLYSYAGGDPVDNIDPSGDWASAQEQADAEQNWSSADYAAACQDVSDWNAAAATGDVAGMQAANEDMNNIRASEGATAFVETNFSSAISGQVMAATQGPVGKAGIKKQGREVNETKRQNPGWKQNPNVKTNRPMKKHTPSPDHQTIDWGPLVVGGLAWFGGAINDLWEAWKNAGCPVPM
jgi:hypothetical protein